MAKKKHGDKPKYGAKELSRMVDKVMSGNRDLTLEQSWLYAAAAHALDLYEVSKISKSSKTLDFTSATSDGVSLAVVLSASMLNSLDKEPLEIRQTLAKRLAAYMMFQVYNDLDSIGYEVEFECDQASYALAARYGEGETYRFDFLSHAMWTMRQLILGEPGRDFLAGVNLYSFHHSLYEEFTKPLFEAAGYTEDNVEL